jgi:hypothetical protein
MPSGRGIGNDQGIYWTTDTVNGGAVTETTLNSYQVAAGVLLRDGDSVSFEYYGTFGHSSEDAVIKVTFDGSNVFETSALTVNTNQYFSVRGRIVRVGSGDVMICVEFVRTSGTGEVKVFANEFDLPGAHTLLLTGTATDAQTINLKAAFINFHRVPS